MKGASELHRVRAGEPQTGGKVGPVFTSVTDLSLLRPLKPHWAACCFHSSRKQERVCACVCSRVCVHVHAASWLFTRQTGRCSVSGCKGFF